MWCGLVQTGGLPTLAPKAEPRTRIDDSAKREPAREARLGEQATRRPSGAATLQRSASYLANHVRSIAFDERFAPNTEREPADANIVQQAHDIVVTGAYADDAISNAMNLNHTLDDRLHFDFL